MRPAETVASDCNVAAKRRGPAQGVFALQAGWYWSTHLTNGLVMAEPSSLAGYFDRAERISILAGNLGKAFQDESEQAQNRQASDPIAWSRHKPAFLTYWQTLVRMAPEIESPPDGSGAVGEWLAKAKKVAVEIRDLARTPNAWKFTDYFPSLNSVALELQQAVKNTRETLEP